MKAYQFYIIVTICLAILGVGIYLAVRKPDAPQAQEPVVPHGWKKDYQGKVLVTTPKTYIGKYKGEVMVIMWGKAILDPARPPFNPDGVVAEKAVFGYPLPGAAPFCSIAYVDDTPVRVGTTKVFNFDNWTYLFLGPNDQNTSDSRGLEDNSGAWDYMVVVPEK